MKFIIHADYHIGAPNGIAIKPILADIFVKDNSNTILLGDIVDLANCEKRNVDRLKLFLDWLVTSFKSRYVFGNHERMGLRNRNYYAQSETNKILFTHGDLEANYDRWKEYRLKPHGASWFKRNIVVPFIEKFESIHDRKLRDRFIRAAVKEAKDSGCNVYVAAHFHPKKIETIIYDNVKIIVVPRGRTELEL